jgi:hypothetical protein
VYDDIYTKCRDGQQLIPMAGSTPSASKEVLTRLQAEERHVDGARIATRNTADPAVRRRQQFIPILGWIIYLCFFIVGLLVLTSGVRGVKKDEVAEMVLIGASLIAIGIFPILVHIVHIFLPKKRNTGSFQAPSATKRFGILVLCKGRPAPDLGVVAVAVLGLGLIVAVSHSHKGESPFYRIVLLGGCGITFVYCVIKTLGSIANRLGYGKAEGIIWDIASNEIASGQFNLKLTGGKGGKILLKKVSPDPVATTSTHIVSEPQLEMFLTKQRGGAYKIGKIQLSAVNLTARYLQNYAQVEVVADDELVTLLLDNMDRPHEWLCQTLRQIGGIVNTIPRGRISVTVFVQAQEKAENSHCTGSA